MTSQNKVSGHQGRANKKGNHENDKRPNTKELVTGLYWEKRALFESWKFFGMFQSVPRIYTFPKNLQNKEIKEESETKIESFLFFSTEFLTFR